MSDRERVILIGLDGATYAVLDPLLAAGVMPNLKRLMGEGARGILDSTKPPVTCPAWPSMFTGVNPGKHGVFSFSCRDRQTRKLRTSCCGDVRAPKLWDLLAEAKRNVAFMNVPTTFPAPEVRGVMLTGYVSPDESPDVLSPRSLNADMRGTFGDLKLNWDVLGYRPDDADERVEHIKHMNELLRLRNRQFDYLLDQADADFVFLVHEYPDRVQHIFYHLLDPSCRAYGDPVNRAALEALKEGFREQDRLIGRLVERFGPDANYLVVSDHGFGPVYRWVYVNNLLAQHGLLAIREGKAVADVLARRASFSNETRVRFGLHSPDAWPDPSNLPLVNFARSQAFGGPQLEHAVYVNVKGRFANGTVEPGEPYRRVKRQIIDALSRAVDPQSGERVFTGVHDRDSIYHGDFVDEAPDVVFGLAPGYMVSNETLPSLLARGRFLRDVTGGWQYSGYHLPDGIVVGWGPAFRRAKHIRADIVDIAPTVLYLMGLPIPSYMDGRVMEDALTPGLLDQRAPEFSNVSPVCDRGASVTYTPEQQLEVTKRLEQLGYL